jgi:hypothetical protein
MYLTFVLDKDPEADELYGKLWRLRVFGSEEFVKAVMRKT